MPFSDQFSSETDVSMQTNSFLHPRNFERTFPSSHGMKNLVSFIHAQFILTRQLWRNTSVVIFLINRKRDEYKIFHNSTLKTFHVWILCSGGLCQSDSQSLSKFQSTSTWHRSLRPKSDNTNHGTTHFWGVVSLWYSRPPSETKSGLGKLFPMLFFLTLRWSFIALNKKWFYSVQLTSQLNIWFQLCVDNYWKIV